LADGRCDHVVILTGAGVSAESGLATFRDADGLWENHDPAQLATPEAFARDPALVYRFYNARREQLKTVEPNAAHRAIAKLQRAFDGRVFLVTQNVDDLHERAGSMDVCHMHGTLRAMRCTHCGESRATTDSFDASTACPACDIRGRLRPDVVWFGELPRHMEQIERELAACRLFIAIGTSGVVYPAAGFVSSAREHGALTVEINRERSDVAGFFHHHLLGPAGEVVPQLIEELLGA